MKKKTWMVLIVAIALCINLIGCGTTYQNVSEEVETENGREESLGDGYFTVITSWGKQQDFYYIVYAKDTKVKYFVKWTANQFGVTPLYNADGTLQIYDEEELTAD